MGCYIWFSEEGIGRDPSPPRPLLTVPNVTAHPSTASISINALLYNGPLLCGFKLSIKALKECVSSGCRISPSLTLCSILILVAVWNVWLVLLAGKILEAYNTGVEAFRQHKSDGLTADRIDSTMLNMEEVRLANQKDNVKTPIKTFSTLSSYKVTQITYETGP